MFGSIKVKKVLILGSGALKIGEAGEFDYSGSQAVKALKSQGVKVILVNPNIATVQTSHGLADRVYFLPVNLDFVSKIIAKEKPDGILLGFGGQTALNCGLCLWKAGIFEKYKVKVLGTPIEAIRKTEDRDLFRKTLQGIDLKTPEGFVVRSLDEALAVGKKLNYPLMVRRGYELGGRGSGVAFNAKELKSLTVSSLRSSSRVLVEEYLDGWKEIEYEIMRDSYGNAISICNMENLDPMGIHTGESVVIAPSQTLTNGEYQDLRSKALKLVNHLGVVGECNVQFALNPKNGDYRIIEVNARLSRSSALASKATGYPIAFIAALLSLGEDLSRLKNSINNLTTACFEPALDYVVIKIPKWDFAKFRQSNNKVGSQMQSIGEVMGIGRTFEESFQKAVRMVMGDALGILRPQFAKSKNLIRELREATDMRMFAIYEALKRNWSLRQVSAATKIDYWFIYKIKKIVDVARKLQKLHVLDADVLKEAKRFGFSDLQIAFLTGKTEEEICGLRKKNKILPFVKRIDSLAGEFPASTNYLYITYNGSGDNYLPNSSKKIMVLGSGPYYIGSSVEFDWCAVQTVRTLKKMGYRTVVINCNPETVSTDYDESDVLYFEELTLERVMDIYKREKPLGVIVSMGGQVPNNLVSGLAQNGIKIIGTDHKSIDCAEDRYKFSRLLEDLFIKQPLWIEAKNSEDILRFVKKVGYPVLIRPSYVLSGAAMSVAFNYGDVLKYTKNALAISPRHPTVISKFILDAKELELDAVASNGDIVIAAITEHVENAGVHSGDATMVFPAQKIHESTARQVLEIGKKVAKRLKITGPFNIQYLAKDEEVLVIECNLRASRSFPFVSKVSKQNFIEVATKVMMGQKIAIRDKIFSGSSISYVGVKAPQFSFSKIVRADPVVSVSMTSTGEVACMGENILEAFLKSMLATGFSFPKKNILLSLGGEKNKTDFLEEAKTLSVLGYHLMATQRTKVFLGSHGIKVELLHKPSEGLEPSVENKLKNGEINLCINTSDVEFSKHIPDDYLMRRVAVDCNVDLITNIQLAKLLVRAMTNLEKTDLKIKAWDEYGV